MLGGVHAYERKAAGYHVQLSCIAYSPFSLDISGVAGFFGGDVSVSAMATVHVYEGRKWLGWYNQPGSYEIAKRYGQLSRSRFWDALYPGINVDPPAPSSRKQDLHMRTTTPGSVTVATLTRIPPSTETPTQKRDATSILAAIPIAASLAACAGCAYIRDWYCLAVILLGVVSSGLSCYVIGTGILTFSHPIPAEGVPAGDGVLNDGSSELVVLKGPEGAVNSVTRGRFALEYASKPAYHNIGVCSMILTLHFVAQLLLIPQGTLHGQLLFLASLCVSWIYNSYLSSLDREGIQRAILRQQVLRIEPEGLQKYTLGTRTSMVVFTLLVLAPAKKTYLRKVLDDLLPNDTDTWSQWKEAVLSRIEGGFRDDGSSFVFEFDPAQVEDKLLTTLYDDAELAATIYRLHRQGARPMYAGARHYTSSIAKGKSAQLFNDRRESSGAYTQISAKTSVETLSKET
ncbi:hypothetical protein BV20DRAFT_166105 [Pilatotrama ljubarskyi]|nr:hypothetical protein BV20DRAFT_166105 [Pilatotrama ljubarskyi]